MTDRIVECVDRGRVALDQFSAADQATADAAVTAIAWSLYRPANAWELAELAVAETGLGNVPDKFQKNQRKTFGTLRDLMRARTVGVVEEDRLAGIVRIAKPVGLVAALTPSTNPAATPINNAMMAVKGRNAVIIAPPPSAWSTTERAVHLARLELEKIGLPADLVQVMPAPVSILETEELMRRADLVVATGAQDRVRSAYSSGTPAIGVGAGNVPVIVDESADLDQAAELIAFSKMFDNGTSCSSESAVIITDKVYDAAVSALKRAGGHLATGPEGLRIRDRLFPGGRLNRDLAARDFSVLCDAAEVEASAASGFVMVEDADPGPDNPMSIEKISLVVALYRACDFDQSVEMARRILNVAGIGHSAGIHTVDRRHALRLAECLPVARVLVNQAHAVGNGGSFDNGLPFTLTMGCGTWAGNSISENLSIQHFVNTTRLVETCKWDEPEPADLFSQHCQSVGDPGLVAEG